MRTACHGIFIDLFVFCPNYDFFDLNDLFDLFLFLFLFVIARSAATKQSGGVNSEERRVKRCLFVRFLSEL